MELGAFSVSLAVKDIEASKRFYEKLGFKAAGGGGKWQILRNGDHTIGIFQGMFEKNILTFNPGWNKEAQPVERFTDVRELQRALKSSGIELTTEVDETSSGPGYIMLSDPDGNAILVDQHV